MFMRVDTKKPREALNKNISGFSFRDIDGQIITFTCGSGSVRISGMKINSNTKEVKIHGLDAHRFAITLLTAEKHVCDWFERSGSSGWMNATYVKPTAFDGN